MVVDHQAVLGTVVLSDLILRDPQAPLSQIVDPGHIPTISWATTVRGAAAAMVTHGVDALPIVDDSMPRIEGAPARSALQGLITVTDLLRALRDSPPIVD